MSQSSDNESWDVEEYRSSWESDEHWELRKVIIS